MGGAMSGTTDGSGRECAAPEDTTRCAIALALPVLPTPMPPRSTGLVIIAAGVVLVVVGVLAASGGLSWFGRLPGDIRVERPAFRLYVPITSMLLLSIVLGVVSWVLRRLFQGPT